MNQRPPKPVHKRLECMGGADDWRRGFEEWRRKLAVCTNARYEPIRLMLVREERRPKSNKVDKGASG